jgi:hypothetical protein
MTGLFVFVFFTADVADLAGKPTLLPVTDVGNHVLGTATQALGLGGDHEILDFNFGHN